MIPPASTCLAVDLGASSGRVMAGWKTSDGKINLSEVHRFDNIPITHNDVLCWNFDQLITDIFDGLHRGITQAKNAGRPVRSIGIDSWAVDFGLLDEHGHLTGPVVHYRDSRTINQMEKVFTSLPQREIFHRTGIQFLPFNTIYQLSALKENDPDQLHRARHLLMIADLVAYRLTGRIATEYTNATTTQLFEAREQEWSWQMIERLGLPNHIFPEVLRPGSLIGPLRPELAREWDAAEIQVIAVATHDTASAVAAVPAQPGEPSAYLSCGTWSLLGTELQTPNLTEDALAANFTNEGGVAGTFRFLKNIMGLWILQECRRHWLADGLQYTWTDMEQMARQAASRIEATGNSVPLFHVDDPRFLPPGDMPSRIRQACAENGATIHPDDDGILIATILKSLAARYAEILAKIEDLTVQRFDRLYIVGGGVQNRLLLEWTAQATNREVIPGPAEATALGNIGIQMISAGELRDIAELRKTLATG